MTRCHRVMMDAQHARARLTAAASTSGSHPSPSRGAIWRANPRRRVVVGKPNALRCQAVEIGRWDFAVGVLARQIAIAQIIGIKNDDIGKCFLGVSGRYRELASERSECGNGNQLRLASKHHRSCRGEASEGEKRGDQKREKRCSVAAVVGRATTPLARLRSVRCCRQNDPSGPAAGSPGSTTDWQAACLRAC